MNPTLKSEVLDWCISHDLSIPDIKPLMSALFRALDEQTGGTLSDTLNQVWKDAGL